MVPRPAANRVAVPSPSMTYCAINLKGTNLTNRLKLPVMLSVAPLSMTRRWEKLDPTLTCLTVQAIMLDKGLLVIDRDLEIDDLDKDAL